ncbi:MAG TPA: ComEA family DNA-binding protein [Mycobacteriales bacterium]|jgi:competence protein ComEA|nr:ComEA family DNA-binding protein [Mycobacteriales bacterium]
MSLRPPDAVRARLAALVTPAPPPEPAEPVEPVGSLRGGRFDPGPRGAAALALVAVLAVAVTAFVVWRGRPRAVSAPPPPAVAVSTVAPAMLVVDVTGAVRRPGLVRVPAGSRVADALAAAGGVRPGAATTGLNLARKVVDGEQLVVGGPASPGAPAAAASGGLVNLNTATADDLDALPGVGPVLAQRIVEWRTQHGSFASVDQLREVSGIGARKLASLRDLVAV